MISAVRGAAVSGGKIILYFVLVGMSVAGFVELVLPAFGLSFDKQAPVPGFLVQCAINFLAMSLPALLMLAVFDRKSPATMGLSPKGLLSDMVAGAAVGIFIFVFALLGAFAGGWARIDMGTVLFSVQAMGVGALGTLLAAAGEEIMMRGYVLQELMRRYSLTASVIVSSVIFTALHAGALMHSSMALIGAANIFAASVLLSLAYLATRSLWLPIGVHFGWNFAQGPLLGINVSGNDFAAGWHPVVLSGPELMTGGNFGFEGSLLGLAGPLLGILMMVLFGTLRRAPVPSEA